MPSISRLPSGKYRVRWRDAAGKQVTSEAVKSKIEAAAIAREVTGSVRRERSLLSAVKAGRLMDLAAVIHRYCESGVAAGRMHEGRAWEVRNTLEILLEDVEWGTTAAVTAEAVDKWRIEARKAGRGDNPIAYLLAVLRWASGAPLRQPVDPGLFALPRMPRPYRAQPALLTDAEVRTAIESARTAGGEPAAAAIEHLATYGCRPVELCRVLISDLDREAGTLTLRKTKNGSTVTHPLLGDHLASYIRIAGDRGPSAHLFTGPSGEGWWLGMRLQAAQLTNWYRDHCTQHLDASQRGIYCLKDYAISRMELMQIDDRTKATFTGHRTLGVFQRYKATNHDLANAALAKMQAVRCDTA